jgi:hypothetical protein
MGYAAAFGFANANADTSADVPATDRKTLLEDQAAFLKERHECGRIAAFQAGRGRITKQNETGGEGRVHGLRRLPVLTGTEGGGFR